MNRPVLHLTLASILISSSTWAADWTVGPIGSGADFDDIQTAIDAATRGDTIFVAAGTYDGFSIDTGIRILGAGPDFVRVIGGPTLADGRGFWVHDVPQGDSVLLSGMLFDAASCDLICKFGVISDEPFAAVDSCQGEVVLHDLKIHPMGVGLPWAALGVRDSFWVSLHDCSVRGTNQDGSFGDAVRAEGSNLWVSNCVIEGSGVQLPGVLGEGLGSSGGDALRLHHSSLYLARTRVQGGSGGMTLHPLGLGFWGHVGGYGIRATGTSEMKIVGGEGSYIRGGGSGPEFTGVGPNGIMLQGWSELLISESVTVLPGLGSFFAPPLAAIKSNGFSLLSEVPTLYPTLGISAPQASVGSSVDLAFDGNPGSVGTLMLGFVMQEPVLIPGIDGAFTLDLLQYINLGPIGLDAAGQAGLNLAIPANAHLVGLSAWFQWLELTAPQAGFSNPALLILGS